MGREAAAIVFYPWAAKHGAECVFFSESRVPFRWFRQLASAISAAVVVVSAAAEERGAVVEEGEDEEQHERHADGGSRDVVQGVGRGAIAGEEVDEEELAVAE